MDNKNINILSIDAKDIFIANNYIKKNPTGYNIRYKSGNINTKKFINTLDYSLELIKLREIYEKVYRRTDFTFEQDKKEYSQRVINVTFNYSNKVFNKIKSDTYVKFGYDINDIEFKDSVSIIDNELIAIQTNITVKDAITEDVLGKFFYLEGGKYKAKPNINALNSVASLRKDLYKNGFICDGIKYIRYKRSGGSSRIGKCLFIDEKLYSRIHKWELCGLKIKEGQDIDLAALESYISLPLSSIIDTVEINPENILVIKDYDSVFRDDVIVTTIDDNWLKSYPDNVEIKNSIWDGQSLMDISLFGKYSKYGMLLLRNRFFKSCCFNSNIQQWFKDNNITDISQLNGFTLAKNIEDVKLITTPNSIKYLKFGQLEDWLNTIESLFGIVKHDKPTHNFDGRMVQTHYQLLNTLQLSKNEVKEFIQPSLDYVKLLKTDPDVLRYYIKYPDDIEFEITSLSSKNDIIYKMIGLNNKFTQTKLFNEFKRDLTKAFIKNLKCGHVLVKGNYSTLLSCPIEMLQNSIGKFNGDSVLGIGNIHSLNFDYNNTILGSRSPHVTVGNVWLPKNIECEIIDKYVNLTKEIVCINTIGENVLERLSSADMDSDTALLTDDITLKTAAMRNYRLFKVPTSQVTAKKTNRKYTNEEKADLDIKTSVNKIGEIINLSQELNTLLWDKLNNGYSFNDVAELYYDIAKLDVMSCIEIDKAKKEFVVDTIAEMKRIRSKYNIKDDDGRMIKPNFFGHLARTKGYYNSEKKNYKKHDTSMDYLQTYINSFQISRKDQSERKNFCKFIDVVESNNFDKRYVKQEQVNRVIDLVNDMRTEIFDIWNFRDDLDNKIKGKMSNEIRQNCIDYIDKIKFSYSTMYHLLTTIEDEKYSKISRTIFSILFGTPNKAFFRLIKLSEQPLDILQEDVDGEVQIYNMLFKKIQKSREKVDLD
jgi:Trk K+ transport system NAD-binding subunit